MAPFIGYLPDALEGCSRFRPIRVSDCVFLNTESCNINANAAVGISWEGISWFAPVISLALICSVVFLPRLYLETYLYLQ